MYLVGLIAAISSMELVTLSYRDQEGSNFLSPIWGHLASVSGGDFLRKDLGLRVGQGQVQFRQLIYPRSSWQAVIRRILSNSAYVAATIKADVRVWCTCSTCRESRDNWRSLAGFVGTPGNIACRNAAFGRSESKSLHFLDDVVRGKKGHWHFMDFTLTH